MARLRPTSSNNYGVTQEEVDRQRKLFASILDKNAPQPEVKEQEQQAPENIMASNLRELPPEPLRAEEDLIRLQRPDETEEQYSDYLAQNLLEETIQKSQQFEDEYGIDKPLGSAPRAQPIDKDVEDVPINEIMRLKDEEEALQYSQQIPQYTSAVGNKSNFHVVRQSDAINTVHKLGRKVTDTFDKNFSNQMMLADPKIKSRINSFLKSNPDFNAESQEELLYGKLAPAAQLARGQSPVELGGLMLMSLMQDYYNREISAAREIAELDSFPEKGTKASDLSVKERRAVAAIEHEAFFSQYDTRSGVAAEGSTVGRMISNAANIKTDGNENAMLAEMARQVVPESAPEFFIEKEILTPDNTYKTVTTLSAEGMDFVANNMNLFTHALRLPAKLPRVGKDNVVKEVPKKAALRLKGKLNNKSFVDKDAEYKFSQSITIADNTPFTMQSTQVDFLILAGGVDVATGRVQPNALTPLLDSDSFKKIKYGGNVNERTRDYEITHIDGTKERVANHSDSIKDNDFANDLIEANAIRGEVFRFDHFLGGNWRLYVDSLVLNYQRHHHNRANLGFGKAIPFKLNNKKHMMFLKGGIMKKSGLTNANGFKYEGLHPREGALAYDEIINTWAAKYGEMVDLVNAYSTQDAVTKNNLKKLLQDPTRPITKAAKDLIEFADQHNGYYTINAVIEAVKLQRALADPNKKVYATNFMFETDGVANGIANNAMFSGVEKLARKTGVSPDLIELDEEQTRLINERDVYLSLNDYVLADLNMRDASLKNEKSHKDLSNFLKESGILSRNLAKKPLMITGYSAGKDLVIKQIYNQLMERVDNDPSLIQQLNNIAWDIDSVIKELGASYWQSILALLGKVKVYSDLQSKFMQELVTQYSDNPSLPDPQVIMPEGNIIVPGLMAPTITGPVLEVGGKKVRRITNIIDPEGEEVSKVTGEYKGYPKSAIAIGPVITHSMDHLVRMNADLRSHIDHDKLFSKYKTKNGDNFVDPRGGFMAQIFDGYLTSPMFMEEMDTILNEEFVKIGDRQNNLKSLIDTAKKLGYDLNTDRMQSITKSMLNLVSQSRKFMKEVKSSNQFPVLGGVTSTVTQRSPAADDYERNFKYETSIAKGIELPEITREFDSVQPLLTDQGEEIVDKPRMFVRNDIVALRSSPNIKYRVIEELEDNRFLIQLIGRGAGLSIVPENVSGDELIKFRATPLSNNSELPF